MLHLAFGAIGFPCLAAATFVVGGWFDRRQASAFARTSRIAGAVAAVGLVGGAVLSTQVLGVLFLGVAVVAGFAWLAAASVPCTARCHTPTPTAATRQPAPSDRTPAPRPPNRARPAPFWSG